MATRGELTNPVEARAAAEIGRLPYPGWVMVKTRRRIDGPKWGVTSVLRVLAHKATLGVYIQYEPFMQTWTIEGKKGKEGGTYSTLVEAVTVVELRLGEGA